ncbi:MAG: ABC transporter ATP-binding protein [Candidatus Pacebacteria bacterium]|nr:ABC transporter ATP-binding protein [Candidatus Paceibacterota bacterium]
MSNPILTLKDVSFKYHNGTVDVLHDVSFSLEKNSFTILVGPSGCGKSTLIKLVSGLAEPTSGTLAGPKKMAMVFQNGSLLPWYSALDNVLLAFEKDSQLTPEEKKKRALESLELMNIKDLADSYPRDLSGGQRQRVGIARALAAEPELLLLDEPFSALDAETTEALHRELLDIWKSRGLPGRQAGISILMISHSLEEAVTLGERILVMHEGRLVHEHVVRLDYPRDPTTETFGKYIASIRKELKEKRGGAKNA